MSAPQIISGQSQNDQVAFAGAGVGVHHHVDHATTDADKQLAPRKPRKPYTATKTREMWSAEEHDRMIEGLHRYQRDWAKVTEFVGTRSAAQVRSHAQKYFDRVTRDKANDWIPRPRPKRRSSTPYPRKASSNPQPSSPAQPAQKNTQPAFPASSAVHPSQVPATDLPHKPKTAQSEGGRGDVVQNQQSAKPVPHAHVPSPTFATHNQHGTPGPLPTPAVTPVIAATPPLCPPSHQPVWYPSASPGHDPRVHSPSFHQYQHCLSHHLSAPGMYISPYLMSSPVSYDPALGSPPITNSVARPGCHMPSTVPTGLSAMSPHIGPSVSPQLVGGSYMQSPVHPPHPLYGLGLFSPISQFSYPGQDSPMSSQIFHNYAQPSPHMAYGHVHHHSRVCPHGNGADCPKCTALHRYGNVLHELHHLPQNEAPESHGERSVDKKLAGGKVDDHDRRSPEYDKAKSARPVVRRGVSVTVNQTTSSGDSAVEHDSGSPYSQRGHSESPTDTHHGSQSSGHMGKGSVGRTATGAESSSTRVERPKQTKRHSVSQAALSDSSGAKFAKPEKLSEAAGCSKSCQSGKRNGHHRSERNSEKYNASMHKVARSKRSRSVQSESESNFGESKCKKARSSVSPVPSSNDDAPKTCDERKEMYDAVHTLQILATTSAPTTPAGSQGEDA